MSGHADTIRRDVDAQPAWVQIVVRRDAVLALVAENQQQAQENVQQANKIAWLEGRLDEAGAENQRLRDALERILAQSIGSSVVAEIARAALAGTPSEDTE